MKRYSTRFKRIQLSISSNIRQKGEQLVSMMPAIKKDFNLLVDDIVELSRDNDALRRRLLR